MIHGDTEKFKYGIRMEIHHTVGLWFPVRGVYTVIKHAHFKNRANIGLLLPCLHGEGFGVDSAKISSMRHTPPIMQYMIMHLGGMCVVKRTLEEPNGEKKLMSHEQIDAGYDYIQDSAPLSTSNNQHLRWIAKQKNTPTSPIFSWSESKIEKAIDNHRQGKSLATIISDYPLSLYDIKTWILTQAIAPCLSSCMQKSIFLAGVSGIGKTPVANSIAMCVSKFFIEDRGEQLEPSFRSAANMDFFRGDVGSVYVPAILDDGDTRSTRMASLKAFLDVSCEDAKAYVRWTSVFFAKHQLRIACSNSYDNAQDHA